MAINIFVEKVANKIIDLGLTAPAILLLEAHKPLAFLGSQLLLVAQPMLDIFLPQNLTSSTADLLADPDQLEQLINRLETTSTLPSASKAPINFEGDNP
jgi:hypothetical protein